MIPVEMDMELYVRLDLEWSTAGKVFWDRITPRSL